MAEDTAADNEDRSDRQQLVDELRQARERLELALTGSNVGLWDWNPQTSKVYFSATFKRQLGYPANAPWDSFEEWRERLHPDDREAALATVSDYFARTLPEYKSIFRLQCIDGSYRWILAQGKAAFDEQNQPLRMTGVHVDITEQVEVDNELKRVNAALADANEALHESNVELQQFAYVASHDLQTPLRAIAGFAQFLKTDYVDKLDERAIGYVDRIVGGAKRMQTMINDLLAYSRVESQAAGFKVISLQVVYEDAISLLESAIADSKAQVTCEKLPEVRGDPAQVSQLFANLIGNAIKYNRKVPSIRVYGTNEESQWRVCVEDNGIGIEEQYRNQVFEVFRRLHPRDEFPGTGIGLAICRRIAHRHDWSIEVADNPGGGSRFWVIIPKSD